MTIQKECAGPSWWKVGKMRTLDVEPRFPKLFRLMAGLLYIPSSKADAERGFSILWKVHTDERASLSHSTIVGLMSLKFNNVLLF